MSSGLWGPRGNSSTQAQPDQCYTLREICLCKTHHNGYGPAPFDEGSEGDCIIKASDGVNYKLNRVILRHGSPVWKDMFDLPQPCPNGAPTNSKPHDLPFIELSEPSTTLLPLFRLLYPISKDQVPTFELALDLFLAYDKYDIDISHLAPYLADLLSHPSLQNYPLEAYGLAWRLQKGDIVGAASRYLHQVNLEKKETKDKLLRYSGDLGSLLALHELRDRRELALDYFISALPLEQYRCAQHANLSTFEAKELRISVRRALGSANPHCSDFVKFLGLWDVFTVVGPGTSGSQGSRISPPSLFADHGGFVANGRTSALKRLGAKRKQTKVVTFSELVQVRKLPMSKEDREARLSIKPTRTKGKDAPKLARDKLASSQNGIQRGEWSSDVDEQGFSKSEQQRAMEESKKTAAAASLSSYGGAGTSRDDRPLTEDEWAGLGAFQAVPSSPKAVEQPQAPVPMDVDVDVVIAPSSIPVSFPQRQAAPMQFHGTPHPRGQQSGTIKLYRYNRRHLACFGF
ncbi:hypothetical protein FRC01_000616 [Tulasnella sp. 417]|nr:hypothetical protein FRC01_000616 [Tulasnella sp. 417]